MPIAKIDALPDHYPFYPTLKTSFSLEGVDAHEHFEETLYHDVLRILHIAHIAFADGQHFGGIPAVQPKLGRLIVQHRLLNEGLLVIIKGNDFQFSLY